MNKYEKAKYFLLFYALKDEEIKERILKENIDFGVKEEYIPEEIEDYFKLTKRELIEKEINELKEKLHKEKEPLEQAKILSEIMKLKGVGQNER